MQSTERFAWADDANRADALCITVFQNTTEQAVLDAFQVDAASKELATYERANDRWTDDVEPVQIWTAGQHVVAVAPNGYLASLPDVLVALAAGGDAMTVFWNVNANMQVLVVRDGEVVRAFDPLFHDEEEGEGDALLEEANLPFGDEHASSSALVLLERLTGFAADEALLLDTEHPTYDVTRATLEA